MEIVVSVSNTYTQAVPEIALVFVLPASLEILNYRLSGDSTSRETYQDVRDDRLMVYFQLGRGNTRTFSFRVNKVFSGSFLRPAIHAYAMYDESIRALIPGSR